MAIVYIPQPLILNVTDLKYVLNDLIYKQSHH